MYLYSVHVRTKIKWRNIWKKPFASLEAQWELRVRIAPSINQFTREYDNTRKWLYCNKVFRLYISSRNLKNKKRVRESLRPEVAWRGNGQDQRRNAENGDSGVLLHCIFVWNSCLVLWRGVRAITVLCNLTSLRSLNNVKQFWAFHFSCRRRILNRECQACRKMTVITNPKAACDLSCHF